MAKGSKISRALHFWAANSFTQIIKVATEVLKEKSSISSSTFLMVLCRVFRLSARISPVRGGLSIVNCPSGPEWYRRHNFFKKLYTPEIPAVFQGLDCSKGPKNISYKRRLSAPYSSQILSGLTTLYLDLDIFSTSRVTLKVLSFFFIKGTFRYSVCQFLKPSTSKLSDGSTKATSVWIS